MPPRHPPIRTGKLRTTRRDTPDGRRRPSTAGAAPGPRRTPGRSAAVRDDAVEHRPRGGGRGAGRRQHGAGRREAREALAVLCRTYWYPLYAYVRARGHGADEAQDLTQSFFARLLERTRCAPPTRSGGGSGRSCSRRSSTSSPTSGTASPRRSAAARPAGVARRPVRRRRAPLRPRAGRHPDPGALFERGWAVTLLDTVLDDLRARYAAEAKGELFERLKPYLAGDAAAPAYAQTASEPA